MKCNIFGVKSSVKPVIQLGYEIYIHLSVLRFFLNFPPILKIALSFFSLLLGLLARLAAGGLLVDPQQIEDICRYSLTDLEVE